MTKLFVLIAGVALLIGCVQPAKFPTDTRSAARAALLAMAYGGQAAYHMCAVHVQDLAGQGKMASAQEFADKCEAILDPAGDGIRAAAAAVDGWNAVDSGQSAQQKVGCAGKAFVAMATDLEALTKDADMSLPVALTDGVEIAKAVLGLALPSCDAKDPAK